jgi:hypothetical protein
MKGQVNIFHFIVTTFILVVCGMICVEYGWISAATFKESPGVNGFMYYYYRMDRIIFAMYKLLIAMVSLLLIVRTSFFCYKRDRKKLTKCFFLFAVFISFLVLCEVYMNSRFVGKG